MKALLILALVLSLAGCVSDGMTPDQLAAVDAIQEQNVALAKAHKITFVEAAARTNAQITTAMGGQLAEQQRLLNAYRLALASEVDAGHITPEVAAFQHQEKAAQINADARQAQTAKMQAFGDGLQQAADSLVASQAANRPVTCNSTAIANTLSTTCR